MSELTVRPVDRLAGEIRLPGDKSISHRALLISALAEGKSIITGLQSGADCLATRRVLAGLGVRIETLADGSVAVFGSGPAGFRASPSILDCANSGTTMRLMAGIAAGLPFATSLTGDASLRKRPMARVTVPLREMGARIQAEPGELPPLIIQGGRLTGREHRLTVASAQVKSCLLLAGLLAAGRTTVIEPAETRDHTERMLGYFGGRVERAGRTLSIEGGQRLAGRPVRVVGDFSAAAFFLAAGAIVPEAELVIPEVGLNPSRTAFLELLRRMGAVIEAEPGGETAGEPSGRLVVRGGHPLRGVTISGPEIPNLIDELPLAAVLGLNARGRTEVRDAAELRVKESDRIAAIVGELRRLGAEITERPDGFIIEGPQRLRGGRADSRGDHRIAMCLAVAGLAAAGETVIEDSGCVAVSFPGFEAALGSIIA